MPHKKPTSIPKPPENTGTTRWGIPWRIVGLLASGVAGFLITPYMQVGNDLKAHAIYACMAMNLYLFVLLLIYLYAYKEELSEFTFKIFNAIKNFTLNIWQKIKSIKKPLKTFAFFTVLALLLSVECFLIYKVIESFNLHSEKIRGLPNDFNFSLKSNELSAIQNTRKSTFLYTSGALLVALLLTLPFTKRLKFILQEYILRVFVLTVVFGGVLSFFIPAFLYNYGFIGDTKDLTTALFTITGGTIALFSLIKNHQKSELEREQLDTQKQKDARDHIHQLHSSYSDRFDKAVVELNTGDAKAAFAAVYKLIHLGDEWLNHNVLANEQNDQEKLKKKADEEIQTIINVLCKYIRTMPKNFTEEDLKNINSLPKNRKETLNGEIEIRRLIFSEISDRLSKPEKDNYAEDELLSAGKEIPITRGSWSKFKFNFTQAPIFYPLINLTIENSDFKDATFYPNSLLININFHGIADFSYSTFTHKPELRYIKFYDYTRFVNVDFKQGAIFKGVTFYALTDFSYSRFRQLAQFLDCAFRSYALFSNTRFRCPAEFKGVEFNGSTTFNKSIFKHDTSFESINVLGEISFRESIFMKTADFYNVGTGKKLSFYNSQFHGKFKINYILNFTSVNFTSDLFSYKETHVFGIDQYSTSTKKLFYPGFSKVGLEKDSVTYTHTLPSSARLFDPSSWDEEKQEYTRVSKPTK